MLFAYATIASVALSGAVGGWLDGSGNLLIGQEPTAAAAGRSDFEAARQSGDVAAARAAAAAWSARAGENEERMLVLAASAWAATFGAEPTGASALRARVLAELPAVDEADVVQIATIADWMFEACLAAEDLAAAEAWVELLVGPAAAASPYDPAYLFAVLGYAGWELEEAVVADRCYARAAAALRSDTDPGFGFQVLAEFALTRRALGDHPRALALLAEAERLLGEEAAPLRRADIAMRRAGVWFDLGEHARADAEFAIAMAAVASVDADEARRVRILAADHAARSRRFEAAAAWLAGLTVADEPLLEPWQRKTVRAIESRLALSAGDPARARALAEEALSAIEPDAPREWLLLPWLARARAALAQAAFAEVEEALRAAEAFLTSPEVLARGDARMFLRTRYADWLQLAADLAWARAAASAPELRPAIVAAAWDEVDRWKARTLAEEVGSGSAPHAKLAEDSVLLDFVGGETRLYAFRDWAGRMEILSVGGWEEAAALLERYHGLISDPSFTAPVSEIAAVGHALHRLLLAGTLPSGARRILVVPEAAWPAVPFAAFVTAAPPAGELNSFTQLRFAIEDACFVHAPSRAIGLRLRRAPAGDEVGEALVLADPQCSDGRWPPLPGTRVEAASVQAAIPAARLFVGAAARKQDFLAALAGADVVHVASHALSDPLAPERSRIACSGEGEAADLTLAELRARRLRAGLVVLSACETAGGRALRGEGVQSLAAGFLQAGAGSVVATLWPVFDADASRLMSDFYDARQTAGDVGLALRAAQIALLRGADASDLVALSRGAPDGGRPVAPAAGGAAPLEGHPMRWASFVYFGPFGSD